MEKCMMLHNRRNHPKLVPDGKGGQKEDFRMRPGTPTPDKHWSSMVLARLGGPSKQVQVCGSETAGDGPEIWISRHLKDVNEEGFVWLMKFIESEDIAISSIGEECRKCAGHPACVSVI